MKGNFSALDNLIAKMGATETEWISEPVLSNKEKQLINSADGLDLDLSKLEQFINENGVVMIEGRPAVLWIKYTENSVKDLQNDPLMENIKRFHIFADCTTMKRMKNSGKYDKYAVGYRQDGKFNVYGTQRSWKSFGRIQQIPLKEIELGICMHCLDKAKDEYYRQVKRKYSKIPDDIRRKLCKEFSIKDYFDANPQPAFTKPKFSDDTMPDVTDFYGPEFKQNARITKERNKWCCEDCGLDCSKLKHRRFLHAHHKSSNKADNDLSNLQALCIQCHQDRHRKEFKHKNFPRDAEQCKKLQIEQGIRNENDFTEIAS